MPLWVAAILGGLVQSAGTLVGKVLISLGMGYVVFTGVDFGIEAARDQLIAAIGGLPSLAVAVASTMKLGTCVSILTSALAARLLLMGLSGGAMRRLVTR